MNIVVICFILYINGIVHTQFVYSPSHKLSEDGRLTFPELATKYGFYAIQEDVITEDGYILTLFHIPGDIKKPVLLIHGNTPTCDCWISRGNISMAIVLATLRYDVWAINLRGTRYSRKHISLDPDKEPARFFNYSFYEQAIYDVPVTIDFILKKNRQPRLTVIAHSVGTTLLYVLCAEKPKYNYKIKVGISLAPISFLQHVRGITSFAIAYGTEIVELVTSLNMYELFSFHRMTPILQEMCLQPTGYDLCIKFMLSMVLGMDLPGMEPEFMSTFFGHFPGGSTRKIFEHLLQVSRSKRFARYDYGPVENLKVYRSLHPPLIDLKKVSMKSALFVGKEDYLSTVEDAELLRDALPNVQHFEVLPYRNFNHADFVWGRYMQSNFYPYLLDVMMKYD